MPQSVVVARVEVGAAFVDEFHMVLEAHET
jgi:hypothetical protein